MTPFFKSFLFFIKLAILIGIGLFVSQYQGEITLAWPGHRLHLGLGTALVAFLAVSAVCLALLGLWRGLWRFPQWLMTRRAQKKQRNGERAILEGWIAIAAGETKEAQRLSQKALQLTPQEPFATILSAQAFALEGHQTVAEEKAMASFHRLANNRETSFLGWRGLALLALKKQRWHEAQKYLERALRTRPSSPWALQQLFESSLRLKDFETAERLLPKFSSTSAFKKSLKKSSPKLLTNKSALFYWLKAEKAFQKGDLVDYEGNAKKAAEVNFPVAAIHLSLYYVKLGKYEKARHFAHKGFEAFPHPDFGAVLKALTLKKQSKSFDQEDPFEVQNWRNLENKTLVSYYQAVEEMTEELPTHPESLYLLASAAIEAELWGKARSHLDALNKEPLTQRVCFLMMRLCESGLPPDKEKAQEWLQKAAVAPQNPTWQCQKCSHSHNNWQAFCESCEGFETLRWGAGSKNQKSAPRIS